MYHQYQMQQRVRRSPTDRDTPSTMLATDRDNANNIARGTSSTPSTLNYVPTPSSSPPSVQSATNNGNQKNAKIAYVRLRSFTDSSFSSVTLPPLDVPDSDDAAGGSAPPGPNRPNPSPTGDDDDAIELSMDSRSDTPRQSDGTETEAEEVLDQEFPRFVPMQAARAHWMQLHKQGMQAALTMVMDNLDDEPSLCRLLQELGANHFYYDASEAHFKMMGEEFVLALGECVVGTREELDDELEEDWARLWAKMESNLAFGLAVQRHNYLAHCVIGKEMETLRAQWQTLLERKCRMDALGAAIRERGIQTFSEGMRQIGTELWTKDELEQRFAVAVNDLLWAMAQALSLWEPGTGFLRICAEIDSRCGGAVDVIRTSSATLLRNAFIEGLIAELVAVLGENEATTTAMHSWTKVYRVAEQKGIGCDLSTKISSSVTMKIRRLTHNLSTISTLMTTTTTMLGIIVMMPCPLLSIKNAKKSSSPSSSSSNSSHQQMLYDLNLPAYETVLTPIDFEQAMELEDNPMPGSTDWDSEAMYSMEKFEGDIANDLNASTVALFIRGAPPEGTKGGGNDINQLNAIRDRRQLWRNARIPRSVIASAMQEYAKSTCIQWTPRTAVDNDYVYIVPERGCYSMVGRTGGRQILSLGNGCIQKGIIIHEMMHATGFFHEQSRTDRDTFITILWHNILPGMQGQFEKYSAATIQTLGSDYDYGSIMHYGPNAFTRNGLPTMVPRRQTSIGQRSGFSKLDAWKINALYECPAYGGSYASTVIPPAQPITTPPTVTMLLTTTPMAASTPRFCRNTRPDCDHLARQGWCTRNPQWMRDHCPMSCGWCPGEGANGRKPSIGGLPSPIPIVPATQSSSPAPPVPEPSCEDLRVDCAELAKRRYCITAPTFTSTYCARTCGFCFVPLATDMPAPQGAATAAPPVITSTLSASSRNGGGAVGPTVHTQQPLVTFWPPPARPDNQRPPGAVTEAPPPQPSGPGKGRPPAQLCRDRKHFCAAWAKSGFCRGIFLSYMKKNCMAACGLC
ncbi:Astacin (Peptidase M12A) [Globodera pallida]|nr:Astacin (Peptidase M12A) [Globodera pallida]